MLCHICRECGTDLASARAAVEPHYGLMIVRCPTCATVAVRRRHPMLRRWQTLRRIDWALTVMAANAVALVALVAGVLGCIMWFAWTGSVRPPAELLEHHAIELIMFLLVIPLLTGTWLTAGLSHWRRPVVAWIVFAILVAMLLGVTTVSDIIMEPSASAPLLRFRLGLAMLVLIMIVAMAGIGPGLVLLKLLHAARRAQWRWRRRRGRKERG